MSIEITLITTGGTIDGADSDKGSLRHSSDAAKWLEKQPGVRVVHVPVVNKDSRLLSGDDREKIVEAVYNSPSDRVLVTHGTFTMRDGQAIKLAGEKRKSPKVVLLVGSWANARGGSRQALAEPPGGGPPLSFTQAPMTTFFMVQRRRAFNS